MPASHTHTMRRQCPMCQGSGVVGRIVRNSRPFELIRLDGLVFATQFSVHDRYCSCCGGTGMISAEKYRQLTEAK